MTSHVLVFLSVKWDNPAGPAFFARLHPACEGARHLPRSTCPASSFGKGGPVCRTPPGCHMLPCSSTYLARWYRCPFTIVSSWQGQNMVPDKPQGTPSSMLVASSSPQVRKTRASPHPVCFAVLSATEQLLVVNQLPKCHTPCHSSPDSLRTLLLKPVFTKAAPRIRSETWPLRLIAANLKL